MSRIGKMPIPVPKGVTVRVDGATVAVKGPKGELTQDVRPEVAVRVDGDEVVVERTVETKKARGFHGLYRQLIRNMVVGVTDGFTRNLAINGVGYRAELKGSSLMLNLGYSNPIEFVVPDGVTVTVEGPTKVVLTSISKELVGKVASEIRAIRPPEPYKGKGVKYEEERIRRKVGKSGIK